MSKILITGSSGLVGSRVIGLFLEKRNLLTPEILDLDITSTDSVSKYFKNNNAEVVINFAA